MAEQLTLKQETFVNAYLGEANGNGSQAARIAGYKGDNDQIKVTASQNLTKTNIINAIETEKAKLREQFAERRKGLLADVDEVKQEILEAKADFPENPGVRVQLIARRLEAIDREAKLTGAYVKDAENPTTSNEIAAKLAASLQSLGWSDEKIAELTKRPIASLVGAQELGEAD